MFTINNNVCIGFPVRERAWVLPYTLESIVNLDYPKKYIGLRFIVNDSKDATFKMLLQFKKLYREQYRYIVVELMNFGTRPDERKVNTRDKTIWIMGRLKNAITDALSMYDNYWLYMDSDICLQKDTLKLLIEADKDVIAGWCRTSTKISGIYNFLKYNAHMRRYDREFDYKEVLNSKSPVKMDLVAGIFLMKTWLFKKGRVKFYQASVQNCTEDEGATRDLIRLNVERWLHPKAFVYHIMDMDCLEEYKKKTKLNGLNLDLDLKSEDMILTDEAHLSSKEEARLMGEVEKNGRSNSS